MRDIEFGREPYGLAMEKFATEYSNLENLIILLCLFFYYVFLCVQLFRHKFLLDNYPKVAVSEYPKIRRYCTSYYAQCTVRL